MRRFSRPTAVASFSFQQTSDHPTLLRDGHENNSQNYELQRSEFPRASSVEIQAGAETLHERDNASLAPHTA